LRAPVGNGIDIKLGAFDTIIGYEVANSGSNPNYTRSWGYTMEPTSQTGILGSYQINKSIGISAGIANTWSAGINARNGRGSTVAPGVRAPLESDKSWLGAVTLTAPEDWGFLAGSSLYLGIVDGWNSVIGNDVTSYYAGLTIATPLKGVKLGASVDYAHAHDNNIGPTGYAEAFALYASFAPQDSKFSFHLRAEYAEITQAAAGAGLPGEVFALTGTLQYDLWANVLSRLEVRWDHDMQGAAFGGNINAGSDDALLVAANIIYKF
jgi:hypothetical protein